MSARSDLISTAKGHASDIAAADWLTTWADGGIIENTTFGHESIGSLGTTVTVDESKLPENRSARPSELITWVSRLRPDKMRDQASQIRSLAEALSELETTQVFRDLKYGDGSSSASGWGGKGGDAFQDRVHDIFLTSVISEETSRRTAMARQAEALDASAKGAEELQQKVADYITDDNYLGNFRQKVVEAFKDDAAAEDIKHMQEAASTAFGTTIVLTGITGGAGLTAGLASVAAECLFGFMDNTVTKAKDSVLATANQFGEVVSVGQTAMDDFGIMRKAAKPLKPLELEAAGGERPGKYDDGWAEK